jgi:signal transduction histidine kinase
MRLATFIETAKEDILAEAVSYARTLPVLKDATELQLRNHFPRVLDAICKDLRTYQTRKQSIAKSRGRGRAFRETAAHAHGRQRALGGLQIEELIAEYRALRSSVLRLWGDAAVPDEESLREVGRFNEAIDQAVAESVRDFVAETEKWQQIFLGILGHDLRSPLNALALTTRMLAQTAPESLASSIAVLTRSERRMTSLLDSLLEYNRSVVGGGMTIQRQLTDLGKVCSDEVELHLAAHPGARIELEVRGDGRGLFDAYRVSEALDNLVANAVKHGVPNEPVIVRLEGETSAIRLVVENGVAREISTAEFEPLFEPLHRGAIQRPGSERTHLGLGLFIARQIARAHGGDLSGDSSAGKVRFAIWLPKVDATDSSEADAT